MTEKIKITGGKQLKGEVSISGAKNAVLKLMAAALLAKGETKLYNVPELTDVIIMLNVLEQLGAGVKYNKIEKSIVINAENLTSVRASYELVSRMRASFVVLGALVGRYKEAVVALPGGCAIGERKVDFHIKGLEALGTAVKIENGYVHAKAKRLTGGDIYLDIPSVGATENIMLAAVLAEGSTIIQNAAQEPEIVDLANFLNAMGADVSGAGTSEIVINGVKQSDLHGVEYTTIPDRIEAGTYITAFIATKGKGIIKNIFPGHLTFYTSKLTKMGADIKLIDPTSIEVSCKKRLEAVNIITQPYPGFPTDLQSMAMALATVANGVSIITESLYENRFMQVPELRKMGADIHQERNHALIKGVKCLTSANLKASDLRAGASLVIAALMANGESIIDNIYHIDRGYELLEHKFKMIGADIARFNDAESAVVNQNKGNLSETKL